MFETQSWLLGVGKIDLVLKTISSPLHPWFRSVSCLFPSEKYKCRDECKWPYCGQTFGHLCVEMLARQKCHWFTNISMRKYKYGKWGSVGGDTGKRFTIMTQPRSSLTIIFILVRPWWPKRCHDHRGSGSGKTLEVLAKQQLLIVCKKVVEGHLKLNMNFKSPFLQF